MLVFIRFKYQKDEVIEYGTRYLEQLSRIFDSCLLFCYEQSDLDK